MFKDAVISECENYRYELSRAWGDGLPIAFIMLNPSRADANIDDPTIRRCINLSKEWGYSALKVYNLFAFRTPYPRDLKKVSDPIGQENEKYLVEALRCPMVICAWGNDGSIRNGSQRFWSLVEEQGCIDSMFCLGRNSTNEPKHPLYLKKDVVPELWIESNG